MFLEPKQEIKKVEDHTGRIEDVRRKLRLFTDVLKFLKYFIFIRYVLSASDPVDSSPMQPSTRQSSQKDKLLELMRAQSYEALAIQDRTTAAQLQVRLSFYNFYTQFLFLGNCALYFAS